MQRKIHDMWLDGRSILEIENTLKIKIDLSGKLGDLFEYMLGEHVTYEVLHG